MSLAFAMKAEKGMIRHSQSAVSNQAIDQAIVLQVGRCHGLLVHFVICIVLGKCVRAVYEWSHLRGLVSKDSDDELRKGLWGT